MAKYDVCLVGSGAGSSPVAYELSKAGYNVIILEKGPWIKTKDFSKDELLSKKDVYIPNLTSTTNLLVKIRTENGSRNLRKRPIQNFGMAALWVVHPTL
jgi:choline dehydrogenase-like flavoprotein